MEREHQEIPVKSLSSEDFGECLAISYFSAKTIENLETLKEHYEQLIRHVKGKLVTKKMGAPMPWMVPAWEKGLQILTGCSNKRKQNHHRRHNVLYVDNQQFSGVLLRRVPGGVS